MFETDVRKFKPLLTSYWSTAHRKASIVVIEAAYQYVSLFALVSLHFGPRLTSTEMSLRQITRPRQNNIPFPIPLFAGIMYSAVFSSV